MTHRYLVLAAAVSLTAFTLTARAEDKQVTATAGDSSATLNVTSPTATGQQQSPHAEDIRRVLARVTEDAVKGNVKQVADNFTSSSQDQFNRHGKKANLTGPDAKANTDDNQDANKDEMKALDDQLKQTSQQLQDAWKAKYGHDFNIDRKNEEMVYGGTTFQILKGDMTASGAARTAGAQIGGSTGAGLDANSTTSTDTDKQHTGTARIGDTTVTGTVNTTDDDKKDKDHDRSLRDRLAGTNRPGDNPTADAASRMATVMAQESHGAPTLSLTLVNEGTFGNQWRIQPMAGLDYKTLSQNLNHHLKMVLDMKDQWPQDENEATRALSHHVLAALAMPMHSAQSASSPQQPDAAQPASSTQQPTQNQETQQPQQNR